MYTARWNSVVVVSYWVTLTLQLPLVVVLFPGIDFLGFFICKADLLVEIFLEQFESFPVGLENDVIKFRDRCVRAQSLERLPHSDRANIDN